MKTNPKCFIYQFNFSIQDVIALKSILTILVLFATSNILAQKDLMQKKDSTEIRCKILMETPTIYTYAYINEKNKVKKATILISEVENIQ